MEEWAARERASRGRPRGHLRPSVLQQARLFGQHAPLLCKFLLMPLQVGLAGPQSRLTCGVHGRLRLPPGLRACRHRVRPHVRDGPGDERHESGGDRRGAHRVGGGGQHARSLELREGFVGKRQVDGPPIGAVSKEQDGVADDVDQARHAAAPLVHHRADVGGELQRRSDGGSREAVIDVGHRILGIEGTQVIADGDSLSQLLQFRLPKLLSEVRLPDQDNLDQLRLLCLEIREHPHLFEGGECEVLRFVDHQQHEAPRRALADQEITQLAQHARLARFRFAAEIDENRLEELVRLQHRVHETCDGRLAIEPAQQRLKERRLARSDLARDHHEPGLALDAETQVAQGLSVYAARVQVIRVRAERERTLAELVKAFVHRLPASRTG